MFIIDLHNDIASNVLEATGKDITKKHELVDGKPLVPGLFPNNNVDFPRLLKGDVRLVFTSLFGLDKKSFDELAKNSTEAYNFEKLKNVKFGLEAALQQLSYYQGLFQSLPEKIIQIRTKNDAENLKKGRVGFLIHMEGIDFIDKDMLYLDAFYNFGVRSLGLTWRNRNHFGSGNNSTGGLTLVGKKLIKRANKMGMILDLAHTNQETFWDCIKCSDFPIVVSHTLCKKLYDNSRNLTDEQIKAVANLGGLIGMAAIPEYMGGTTLNDYVTHFDHIINLVGDDFVCFGTDFDGLVDPDDQFMNGFTGSDGFPNVISVFEKRGYSKETIEKICNKNPLRIINKILK